MATRPNRETRWNDVLRPFRARFFWVGTYFAVLLLVGTIGYVAIEAWEWGESLYMAAVTASSVG